MPSILLLTNDFGPRAGGIETFIIGLLERIPRGEVVVYTSSQGDTRDYDQRWLEKFGVEVIRDRSSILLPTPRVVAAAIKVMKSRSLETVWFGAAAPLAISARSFKKAGAKRIIAMTHGHEVWWAKIPPFSLALRWIGKHTNQLTYLGEFTGDAVSAVVPREKLIRIAPGIDLEHFQPSKSQELRIKYGIGTRPTIVSVGRLVHRKGQDRLVEALPMIKEHFPDVLLVFIGEGPHRKVLDQLAAKHGVSENILIIGRIDYSELPQYISLGDLFAMPCRSRLFGLEVEGLGIVYLEASACGLPVVAGDSGGAPDAVIEGETGFVVNGNDRAAISARIIELLSDSEKSAAMGARGREWVNQEWNWKIWSERFNQVLGM